MGVIGLCGCNIELAIHLVPFPLNREKEISTVNSVMAPLVKANLPSAMGHVLPNSVNFSKSETATLGLALLVVVAALLLGTVVVATLYCLLIR